MLKNRAALLVVFLFATHLAAAPVDRVVLSSGEVFYGKILRNTKREVSIQLASGGIVSFRQGQVRKVVQRLKHIEDFAGIGLDEEALDAALFRSEGSPTHWLEGKQNTQPVIIVAPKTEGDHATPESETTASAKSRTLPTREAYVDKGRSFSVLVPPGLIAQEIDEESDVILNSRDPVTLASFVVTAHVTDKSLIHIKKQITRSYASRFKNHTIVQDKPIESGDYEGWLVEIESQLGAITFRQIQVFARNRSEILILSFSTSEQLWKHYEGPFQESIQSLRILEPDETPEPQPAGSESATRATPNAVQDRDAAQGRDAVQDPDALENNGPLDP